jgi:predicted transcriptional regulator
MVILMPFSHSLILEKIRELNQSGEHFTIDDIATKVGCSRRTVERAIPHLICTQKLERSGPGKRGGYSYKVIEKNA